MSEYRRTVGRDNEVEQKRSTINIHRHKTEWHGRILSFPKVMSANDYQRRFDRYFE